MTEIIDSHSRALSLKSLVLEDHSLYARHTDEPVAVDLVHQHLNETSRDRAPTKEPRLRDVDEAYTKRRLKYAGRILAHLMRHEPCYYSSQQNRTALNKLAHPMQKRLALKECGGVPKAALTKDIEAIYGNGGPQLGFLLSEARHADEGSKGRLGEIEGSLSELAVFLLVARSLTGEDTDRYSIVPSTNEQDRGEITEDGLRHGFDFTVIRDDAVRIPLQVKTGIPHPDRRYPEHILVVSVAELIDGENASPRELAEALDSEISGASNYNKQLIDTASERLFTAFDSYGA
jgi:hypothetical protein